MGDVGTRASRLTKDWPAAKWEVEGPSDTSRTMRNESVATDGYKPGATRKAQKGTKLGTLELRRETARAVPCPAVGDQAGDQLTGQACEDRMWLSLPSQTAHRTSVSTSTGSICAS